MKGLRALIMLLFFFFLNPQPASSALSRVHLQVIRDVLALSPSGLRTYLTDSQRGLERGAIFLDHLPTIFASRHHDPAHVTERIDELAEGLGAKIREQKTTQYNMAVLFGVLSHYVVDAYLPGRVDIVVPLPPVTFQGFERLPIPSEVVGQGIGWRQEQRREGKKDEEILVEAYHRAVEGVANLWFTVWQEAGGSLSDVALPGTQLRAPLKKPRRKKEKPPEGPPEAMKREVQMRRGFRGEAFSGPLSALKIDGSYRNFHFFSRGDPPGRPYDLRSLLRNDSFYACHSERSEESNSRPELSAWGGVESRWAEGADGMGRRVHGWPCQSP